MNKKTLIFPGGMSMSLSFMETCRLTGQDTIGASSLHHDSARNKYPSWAYLPYITEPDFNECLSALVHEQNIGTIYTPNIVVSNHLREHLQTICPGVTLISQSPVDDVLNTYRSALKQARFWHTNSLDITSSQPAVALPSEIQLASFFRSANLLPGMCDNDKIHALLEIFRRAVKGDVVEIGSWWGKSAYILSQLSYFYSVGNVLCVDPWLDEELTQESDIVNNSSKEYSADEAHTIFQMSLYANTKGNINFIRATSVKAAESYTNSKTVKTPVFGVTQYTGKISVLHIDGNHDHDAVKNDINAWKEHMADGGWIIFDDYIWPYGDGPKIIGDQFLEEHQGHITAAFVMGSALFLQFAR